MIALAVCLWLMISYADKLSEEMEKKETETPPEEPRKKGVAMDSFSYYLPTKIYFERGGLERYLPLVKNYGTKALVVTGRKSVYESGLLGRIRAILAEHEIPCAVFSEVDPEPSVENVEAGARVCRAEGCDVLVGVGGGSPMDVAKGVAVLAANPGSLKDYFGEVEYPHRPRPVICVPTTCGTASEVTRYAVIVVRDEQTKKTVSSEEIIPRAAILDAQLLATLPTRLVAATGMDALCHAVEGALSRKNRAVTGMFARESVRVLHRALPRAASGRDDDLDGREEVLYGSLLAGFVINHTGTIMVHGMAYSLTIKYGAHHGTANALLLPYVLEYLKSRGYAAEIEPLEGIWGGRDRLRSFIQDLGLPLRLRDLGVSEGDLPELAVLAEKGCARAVLNMKVTPSPDDYRRILNEAY